MMLDFIQREKQDGERKRDRERERDTHTSINDKSTRTTISDERGIDYATSFKSILDISSNRFSISINETRSRHDARPEEASRDERFAVSPEMIGRHQISRIGAGTGCKT